jgi:hypothetical protein
MEIIKIMEIMEHIDAGRGEIAHKTETVNRLLGQSRIAIEEMILGTRPVEVH